MLPTVKTVKRRTPTKPRSYTKSNAYTSFPRAILDFTFLLIIKELTDNEMKILESTMKKHHHTIQSASLSNTVEEENKQEFYKEFAKYKNKKSLYEIYLLWVNFMKQPEIYAILYDLIQQTETDAENIFLEFHKYYNKQHHSLEEVLTGGSSHITLLCLFAVIMYIIITIPYTVSNVPDTVNIFPLNTKPATLQSHLLNPIKFNSLVNSEKLRAKFLKEFAETLLPENNAVAALLGGIEKDNTWSNIEKRVAKILFMNYNNEPISNENAILRMNQLKKICALFGLSSITKKLDMGIAAIEFIDKHPYEIQSELGIFLLLHIVPFIDNAVFNAKTLKNEFIEELEDPLYIGGGGKRNKTKRRM